MFNNFNYKINITISAKLKRSCDEYYKSGMNENGVYAVDVDGSEPLNPGHVYCEMGVDKEGELVGVTRVDHNLHPGTLVRGGKMMDHRVLLQYRSAILSVLSYEMA